MKFRLIATTHSSAPTLTALDQRPRFHGPRSVHFPVRRARSPAAMGSA